MKRKWAFSLFWINLAVAIVVLIQIAVNPTSSARELLHMVAYALVYANLTGVLGTLVLGQSGGAAGAAQISADPGGRCGRDRVRGGGLFDGANCVDGDWLRRPAAF